MIVLHLDFETRSHADLLKWGAHRYAMHPSTEILCAAIGVGSKREEFIGDAEVRALGERFRRLVESGKDFMIRAHNATFERLICWYVAESRYDWPHIPVDWFECSAVEALRANLPQSLAMLAPAVGLSIDKDMEGAALMKKMCQPRADGSWLDGPDERARLSSYCMQDVEVEIMASQRMARLSPSERADWLLDQRINDRGIRIDRQVVRNALAMADAAMKAATKRMQAVTGGAVQTPNQVQRLKNWMASKGVTVDSLRAPGLAQLIADDYDPEVDDLLTTDIDSKLFIPPAVKAALEIRLEVAKASTKKLQRMLDAADPVDDRIRGMMQFHGAHTGRPTGRIVQVLNLPRTRKGVKLAQVHAMLDLIRHGDARTLEAEHGPILHCVADCLRGMLIPAEWHVFMDGDFSNIEGRGVAWHAGFESKLDVFRKADAGLGPGVYEMAAAAIYGIPIEAVEADSFERFIGKTAELACLAPDTEVLTDRGFVRIVDVCMADKVHDGVEWVQHGGVVSRGTREVIEWEGLRTTKDHKFLCGEKWVEAEKVASSPFLTGQMLATATGILKCSKSSKGPRVEFGRLEPGVLVAANKKPTLITCEAESQQTAPNAGERLPPRTSRNISSTQTWCQTTNTEDDCSTDCRQPLDGATTQARACTLTTVAVESASATSGAAIAERSCCTSQRSKGGTIRRSTWTESTPTGDMSRGTSGLCREATTTRTSAASTISKSSCETYDIACAGPRNRFVVRTRSGFAIAHNCGYGGAVGAFTAMSTTFGVEVELDLVETIVAKWRAANKPITNFWYQTADAAIETVLTRRPHVSGVGPGQVEYRMDGSFLCCRLPSGRDLHYPYPEIRENPKFGGPQLTFKGRHPKTKQFVRLETFHGRLVENIVQASSNDIMRHAMHSLERAGFPLVLQIYDEALCEVPVEAIDPAAYRQAMTDLPAWAKGFPLAAGDPWVGQEYRK